MTVFNTPEEVLAYINQELRDSGKHGPMDMDEAIDAFDIDEEDLTCEMIDRRVKRFLDNIDEEIHGEFDHSHDEPFRYRSQWY